MNRLREFLRPARDERPAGDYFVITGECGWFYVSRLTAVHVERQVRRWFAPRWIVFRDLDGSRTMILTHQIEGIHESTETQRARSRAFARARKQEAKADARPWDEDE